jgi:hypothetical protein
MQQPICVEPNVHVRLSDRDGLAPSTACGSSLAADRWTARENIHRGHPSREVVADRVERGRRHRRTGAGADVPEQDNPDHRALSGRRQHRSDRARHRKEPAGQRRTVRHRGKQARGKCRHRHRRPDAQRSGRPYPRHPLGQPGHDQRPSDAAQLRSAHGPGADQQGGEQPHHHERQRQGGDRVDCRSRRGREGQALELRRRGARLVGPSRG